MDDVDIGILYRLKDGRISFRKLADQLGISENTVRNRVKQLEDQSVLQITGLVDTDYLPGVDTAFIGLRTEANRTVEVAEAASRLKGVGISSCVTGRFNVILFLMVDESYTLADFLRTELPTVEGITEVELFPVFKGFNLQSRYVL